jgi:hypothetical protein
MSDPSGEEISDSMLSAGKDGTIGGPPEEVIRQYGQHPGQRFAEWGNCPYQQGVKLRDRLDF